MSDTDRVSAPAPAPRQLPVVKPLPPDFDAQMKRRESDDMWERLLERDRLLALECSVFVKTGKHDLVTDEGATFICGDAPQFFVAKHCTGTIPRNSRNGGFHPCPELWVPGGVSEPRARRKNIIPRASEPTGGARP